MNADLSVAPELAQLALPFVPPPAHPVAAPPRADTDGRLAAELTGLAVAPQRWWDLVRFDPGGPLRVPVPGPEGAWLLVLPPGATADCDCARATLLAGQAAEDATPLRPGRVRVHGVRDRGGAASHRVRGADLGYSVTLHASTRYQERAVAALAGTAVPLRE